MSVCVVVQYPWAALSGLDGLDAPGVIVCSDTRAIQHDRPLGWAFRKQRLLSPSILVCYTTSNGAATTVALNRNWKKRGSVNQIGADLKREHGRLGGVTDLIAIVWRRDGVPQILELMSPDYKPVARSGVIGIGESGPLDWFARDFQEDPRPELEKSTATPELTESFSNFIGHPVEFPAPRFTIEDAALRTAAVLSVGIEQAGAGTVALPLQVIVVQAHQVRQLPIVASDDPMRLFKNISVDQAATKLPPLSSSRAKHTTERRTARQLFR